MQCVIYRIWKTLIELSGRNVLSELSLELLDRETLSDACLLSSV